MTPSKISPQKKTHPQQLPHLLEKQPIDQARAQLLVWYDLHQRPLPWRGIDDPWATWVSEVMLQQTRVASVLEYFDRFILRFPTPQSLAESSWEELSSYWAGLGYYSRARHLHRAAQEVVERHGGEVPDDPRAFRALSGVGPYTAGAVMSIAFQLPEPIVDGNVTRVFSRLYHLTDPPKLSSSQKILWGLAEQWVSRERPGDLNQAIMELGATICTPKKPACLLCPLRQVCVSFSRGDEADLPRKEKRRRPLPVEVYLGALSIKAPHLPPLKSGSGEGEEEARSCATGVWVSRRAQTGLLGGLWGLPIVRWEGEEEMLSQAIQCAQRGERYQEGDPLFRERLQSVRHLKVIQGPLVMIEHRFTHKIWRVYVFHTRGIPTKIEGEDHMEYHLMSTLSQMGVNGPSLKALRMLGYPLAARRGAGESQRRDRR